MKVLFTILVLFISLSLFSQRYEVLSGDGTYSLVNGRSTQLVGKNATCVGMPTFDNRVIFSQANAVTITNTTDETSFIDTINATGSRIIPANTLQEGDVIRINSRNIFSNTGTPTNTIRIYFGVDTIIESTATLTTGVTQTYAEIQCDMKVLKSGSDYYLYGLGRTILVSGIQRTLATDLTGIGVLVDLTVDNKIDWTYTWGTASADNTLISITNIIQILN